MKLQVNEFQKESLGEGFCRVSYIYETQVYRTCRQTHKHVYLIRFQNGSFHSWCLRSWESRRVFPNKDVSPVRKMSQKWDTVTGNEACLSEDQPDLTETTTDRSSVQAVQSDPYRLLLLDSAL